MKAASSVESTGVNGTHFSFWPRPSWVGPPCRGRQSAGRLSRCCAWSARPTQCKDVRCAHSSGFTLLEILLAVALVGLVLVALNTFVFSMGELWGQRSEVRLFEQHVRAVVRF